MNFEELQERVNNAAVEKHGHPSSWEDDRRGVYLEAAFEVLKPVTAAELTTTLLAVVEEVQKRGGDIDHLTTLSVFEDGEFPTAMLYEASHGNGEVSIRDMLVGAIHALAVDFFTPPTSVKLPCCPYCRADNMVMIQVEPKDEGGDTSYAAECSTCGARSPEMPDARGAWAKVITMNNCLKPWQGRQDAEDRGHLPE